MSKNEGCKTIFELAQMWGVTPYLLAVVSAHRGIRFGLSERNRWTVADADIDRLCSDVRSHIKATKRPDAKVLASV